MTGLLSPVLSVCGLLMLPGADAVPTGPTLREEANDANFVLLVVVENDTDDTELGIQKVLKFDPVLADMQRIKYPCRLPDPDAKNPSRYLVFGEVFKNQPDVYQRFPCFNEALAEYLGGALKLDPTKKIKMFRYFAGYLEHADELIADDAFLELLNANHEDLKEVARDLSPEHLAGWLANPKTPWYRLGLYATLLGYCGGPGDAGVLQRLLQDSEHPLSPKIADSVMTGLVLLNPRQGYTFLSQLFDDPDAEWAMRYAGLKTLQFFWEVRPDVLTKRQIIDAMDVLLDQGDICDVVIEDLRKWGRWETAEHVLALRDRPTHQAPVVQRTIIRYALACPNTKLTTPWLNEMKQKKPDLIKDAAEPPPRKVAK